jgi:hypothetical protein
MQPRYTDLPVYLDHAKVAELAEHIAVVGVQALDPQGLRISVRGDLAEPEALALEIVGRWLHTKAVIYREPQAV